MSLNQVKGSFWKAPQKSSSTTAHTGLDLPSENLSGGNCLPLRVRRALQPLPSSQMMLGRKFKPIISLFLIVAAGRMIQITIASLHDSKGNKRGSSNRPWLGSFLLLYHGSQVQEYRPNFHLTEPTSINCGRQQRSLIQALCWVIPYNLPSGTCCLHVPPCQLSCSIHSFP